MSQTDLSGTWQYLGTVTPTFDQWLRFPTSTTSGNATIRLTFYSNEGFNAVVSRCYLRVLYAFPENFYSPWLRIFPSDRRLAVNFPIPQELLYVAETVPRYFEIIKKTKKLRTGWQQYDPTYSVAIESLELIALTEQQTAILEQANRLEATAQILRNLLLGASNGESNT